MTSSQFKILISFLILAGYGWLAFHWDSEAQGESFCLIKNVTGFPCPACGTTRALLLLTHGEVILSVQTNPLGLIAGGFLLIAPVFILTDIARRKDFARLIFKKAEDKIKSSRWLSFSLILMAAVNWAWNIYKGL
jgi:hypothetical protein